MSASLLLMAGWLMVAAEEGPGMQAPAQPQTAEVVIYLTSRQGGGPSPGALSEAVAIYTRDLRLTLQTVASDRAEPAPATIERVTALVRARRARLAFWCVPGPDGRSMMLNWLDARGVVHKEPVPVGEREGGDVYRAVALKLRAILTPESARPGSVGAASGERSSESGPLAAGGRDNTAAPATAAPSIARTAAAERTTNPSTAETAPTAAKATDPAKPPVTEPKAQAEAPHTDSGTAAAPPGDSAPLPLLPPSEWAASLAYAAASFSGSPSLRHGLGLQVVRGLGAANEGEGFAGLEVGFPIERTVAAGSVSVLDVPLRVGARLLPVRSAFVLGLGAFGAVHVLWAGASAMGTSGDGRVALAAAAGVEVVARVRTSWHLSWELRGWGEALVPRTRFLVRGSPGMETGHFVAGLALGVVVPSR